jgi:hypothetical protein
MAYHPGDAGAATDRVISVAQRDTDDPDPPVAVVTGGGGPDILSGRLISQRLAGPRATSPEEVVGQVLAV